MQTDTVPSKPLPPVDTEQSPAPVEADACIEELKAKVVAAKLAGDSYEEVAGQFNVAVSTAWKWFRDSHPAPTKEASKPDSAPTPAQGPRLFNIQLLAPSRRP